MRVAELLILYGLLPAAIASGIVPLPFRWLVFLATGVWVLAVILRKRIGLKDLGLNPVRRQLAGLLVVLIGGAAVAISLLRWVDAVPPAAATRWSLVFVIYPAISVPVQEVFFRGYFFTRYDALITETAIIPVNALLFGFYHAIFGSASAVASAIVAGVVLASTYRRTRNLYLCWLLHYGFGGAVYVAGWAEDFTALPQLMH